MPKNSPTIKEIIMEKTASTLQQPLSLVEDVMRWVFKDVVRAVKIYEEIELSGFGTFLMSQPKLKKRIIKCEHILSLLKALPLSEPTQAKINSTTEALVYYYSKLKPINDKETILSGAGGLEEQAVSTRPPEGANS